MTRKNIYREVKNLPVRALTVADYAKENKWDTAYVYKQWRHHVQKEKKIPFEIVVFRGINFVLPKAIKQNQ